jgi:hypothetical protein
VPTIASDRARERPRPRRALALLRDRRKEERYKA